MTSSSIGKPSTSTVSDCPDCFYIIAELQEHIKTLQNENQRLKLALEESDLQVCHNLNKPIEVTLVNEVMILSESRVGPTFSSYNVLSKYGKL